jgi:hypothetical protein
MLKEVGVLRMWDAWRPWYATSSSELVWDRADVDCCCVGLYGVPSLDDALRAWSRRPCTKISKIIGDAPVAAALVHSHATPLRPDSPLFDSLIPTFSSLGVAVAVHQQAPKCDTNCEQPNQINVTTLTFLSRSLRSFNSPTFSYSRPHSAASPTEFLLRHAYV